MTFQAAPLPLPSESTRWTSLGHACRILGVNESTLRRWADEGQVRSYRTPGGHRRFAESDLLTLVNSGGKADEQPYRKLGNAALTRIRRDLSRERGHSASWYEGTASEESRERLRLLGRRLVDLVPDYLARQGRGRIEAEAGNIGHEYGRELSRIGLSSREAVQAFTFFRNGLTEAAKDFAHRDGLAPEEADKAREQIIALADVVLLALLEAYEPGATAPSTS